MVWEEILVLLPAWTQLILLSATVPNVVEFASWVGRIKQKKSAHALPPPRALQPLPSFRRSLLLPPRLPRLRGCRAWPLMSAAPLSLCCAAQGRVARSHARGETGER